MGDGKRRKWNEVIAPPALQEDKFMKIEESLLPGISNDVTLAKISTLLPVGTFENLSLLPSRLGPAWHKAMQDRLVYDARVLSNSRDSFVIISDTRSSSVTEFPTARAIHLYSLREHIGYRLPPIPQVMGGFPYDCECIALDGKLYVLGGSKNSSDKKPQVGSKDVYVLDLAAQGQWKPCARMQKARANFSCGAKDGKIYAFGGTCGKIWVRGSEVYDTCVNSWSAITAMGSWPPGNEPNVGEKLTNCPLNTAVSRSGEELVVFGGDFQLRSYHPITDTWKLLTDDIVPERGRWFAEFMAEGKLHAMSLRSIFVYDIEENHWKERHSCSFPSGTEMLMDPISVLAVDNEILAILCQRLERGRCLVRSKGFGSDVKELVWEKLPICFQIGEENPLMCFVKL